jgi:hypothetical protein
VICEVIEGAENHPDIVHLLQLLPIAERFHMPLCEGSAEDLDTWTIEMLNLTLRAQNQKLEYERKKAEFHGR